MYHRAARKDNTTIIITRTGANFHENNIQVEINLALIKIAISFIALNVSKPRRSIESRDSSVLHPRTDTSISWNNKLDVSCWWKFSVPLFGWILEPDRLAAPDPKYFKLSDSSASESVMHRPGIGSYTATATFVHDFRDEIYYQNTRHLVVKGLKGFLQPLSFSSIKF